MRSCGPKIIIRCAHCRLPIEGCVGRHGDWMHAGNRLEHCPDGVTLAEPETAEQILFGGELRRGVRP